MMRLLGLLGWIVARRRPRRARRIAGFALLAYGAAGVMLAVLSFEGDLYPLVAAIVFFELFYSAVCAVLAIVILRGWLGLVPVAIAIYWTLVGIWVLVAIRQPPLLETFLTAAAAFLLILAFLDECGPGRTKALRAVSPSVGSARSRASR